VAKPTKQAVNESRVLELFTLMIPGVALNDDEAKALLPYFQKRTANPFVLVNNHDS